MTEDQLFEHQAEGAATQTAEPSLEQQLEEERKKAAEYLDNWKRSAAELQNYRRRVEKERLETVRYATQQLLKRLLEVMDSLDIGLKAVPEQYRNEPWVEGMHAVKRQLMQTLESEGVKPIETEGKDFDPNYHEAMAYEANPGSPEGRIIEELQRGYMLHDRVLRPSRVKVAKGE